MERRKIEDFWRGYIFRRSKMESLVDDYGGNLGKRVKRQG